MQITIIYTMYILIIYVYVYVLFALLFVRFPIFLCLNLAICHPVYCLFFSQSIQFINLYCDSVVPVKLFVVLFNAIFTSRFATSTGSFSIQEPSCAEGRAFSVWRNLSLLVAVLVSGRQNIHV